MITHPALDALCALWLSRCCRRTMPAQKDIDFSELRPWNGHFALIDVRGGSDFRCRHCGAWLAGRYGLERRSGPCAALGPARGAAIRGDLCKACVYRAPVFLLRPEAPVGFGDDYAELVLPFSDDGEAVDRLLLAAYPLPKPH